MEKGQNRDSEGSPQRPREPRALRPRCSRTCHGWYLLKHQSRKASRSYQKRRLPRVDERPPSPPSAPRRWTDDETNALLKQDGYITFKKGIRSLPYSEFILLKRPIHRGNVKIIMGLDVNDSIWLGYIKAEEKKRYDPIYLRFWY